MVTSSYPDQMDGKRYSLQIVRRLYSLHSTSAKIDLPIQNNKIDLITLLIHTHVEYYISGFHSC